MINRLNNWIELEQTVKIPDLSYKVTVIIIVLHYVCIPFAWIVFYVYNCMNKGVAWTVKYLVSCITQIKYIHHTVHKSIACDSVVILLSDFTAFSIYYFVTAAKLLLARPDHVQCTLQPGGIYRCHHLLGMLCKLKSCYYIEALRYVKVLQGKINCILCVFCLIQCDQTSNLICYLMMFEHV